MMSLDQFLEEYEKAENYVSHVREINGSVAEFKSARENVSRVNSSITNVITTFLIDKSKKVKLKHAKNVMVTGVMSVMKVF